MNFPERSPTPLADAACAADWARLRAQADSTCQACNKAPWTNVHVGLDRPWCLCASCAAAAVIEDGLEAEQIARTS